MGAMLLGCCSRRDSVTDAMSRMHMRLLESPMARRRASAENSNSLTPGPSLRSLSAATRGWGPDQVLSRLPSGE